MSTNSTNFETKKLPKNLNAKKRNQKQTGNFPFGLYQTSPLVSNSDKLEKIDLTMKKPIETPSFMKGKSMNIEPKKFVQNSWDLSNQKKMEKLIQVSKSNTQGLLDQLKAMRDNERKKMEALKLVDSADASKSLKDAITFQGSCMQMCPIFETVRRDVENSLSKIEKDSQGNVNKQKAMKVFSRPAAFAPPPLPSDVRPPEVLIKSLNYIIDNLLDLLPENESFIWDRTRSIRQDFTLQNYFGPECIECNEKIVRIHILIIHTMIKSGIEYSKQQELEQLNKTIVTLCDIYDEGRKKGYVYPNEAEIRSYRCLLNPRDASIDVQIQSLPEEILNNEMFDISMSFRRIMSNSLIKERGYLTKKKNGLNLVNAFFQLIKNEKKVPLLLAMFLETYVNEMRYYGFLKIKVSWSKKLISNVSFDTVTELFLFNNDEEIKEICNFYNIEYDTSNRTLNLSTLVSDSLASVDKKKVLSDVSLQFIDDSLAKIGSRSNLINMNRKQINIKETFESPKEKKIVLKPLMPAQTTPLTNEQKKDLRTINKQEVKAEEPKTTPKEAKPLSITKQTEKKENYENSFNKNKVIINTPMTEFKRRSDLFDQTPSKITPNNPTKIVNLEVEKKVVSDSPGFNVDEVKKNTYKIIYEELLAETSDMLMTKLAKSIVRNEVIKAKKEHKMKAIQTVEPTKEDVAFDVRDIVVDKQQREMLLLNFLKSPTIENKIKTFSNKNEDKNLFLTPLKKVKRKLKISKELFEKSKQDMLILKNYINHVSYNMKSNTWFNKFETFDICWTFYTSDWSDVSIKAILKMLNINRIPLLKSQEKINLKVCKYGINEDMKNTQLLLFNTGVNTNNIFDFKEHMESERSKLIDILNQLKSKSCIKIDVLILFWKNNGLDMFDLKFFEKYEFVNSFKVIDIEDENVLKSLELELNKVSINFDFKLNGEIGKDIITAKYNDEIINNDANLISMSNLDEIQRSLRKAKKVREFKHEGRLFDETSINKKRKLSTFENDQQKKKYFTNVTEPLSSDSTFDSPSTSLLVTKNNIPTLNFGNQNQRKSTFNYKNNNNSRRMITPVEYPDFFKNSSSPKFD
ncbi:hypothetical protein ACO0OE_002718 [Hanseniaspora uvarum]